ncbi:MAG: LytTR family DNA-binding domain-containing protein, partial [Ginsengibacter sp.]
MLNAIIIEDEKPAMEVLVKMLGEISPVVNIIARLNSVKESIEYLTTHKNADIIFSDVQLNDGLSFEIFKQTGVQTPVIFTTGYDKFMMMAFENNGIDYLLKPINKNDLTKALLKYRNLQTHFSHSEINAPVENLLKFISNRKKTRLLVKKGTENIALKLEDITLFYTENKVVYVLDRFSKKYISDKTLTELEEELDESTFFRANRQYIININFIKGFKPYEKVKLSVDLNIPEINHSITISQETAPAFRKWMFDA